MEEALSDKAVNGNNAVLNQENLNIENEKPSNCIKENCKDLNDVIISVESRKGGVGKTTAALSAAKVLAQDGYAVLYLDCDIIGTNIAECDNPLLMGEHLNVLKEGDEKNCKQEDCTTKINSYQIKNINLLHLYENYLKNPKDFVPIKPFENWIKHANQTTGNKSEDYIINLIGSEFVENYSKGFDSRFLFDELHAHTFVEFLKEIVDYFRYSINQELKVAVILDNSPGYFSFNSMIHKWIISLGPEKGKFIYVSGQDQQDIKLRDEEITKIFSIVDHKRSSIELLIKKCTDKHSDFEESLEELIENNKSLNKEELIANIIELSESIDKKDLYDNFNPNNYYIDEYIGFPKEPELTKGNFLHKNFVIDEKEKISNYLAYIDNKSPKISAVLEAKSYSSEDSCYSIVIPYLSWLNGAFTKDIQYLKVGKYGDTHFYSAIQEDINRLAIEFVHFAYYKNSKYNEFIDNTEILKESFLDFSKNVKNLDKMFFDLIVKDCSYIFDNISSYSEKKEYIDQPNYVVRYLKLIAKNYEKISGSVTIIKAIKEVFKKHIGNFGQKGVKNCTVYNDIAENHLRRIESIIEKSTYQLMFDKIFVELFFAWKILVNKNV